MNKNGALRNVIRRKYNFWKRNINSIVSLVKTEHSKSDIRSCYDEINRLINEIEKYKNKRDDAKVEVELLTGYIPLSFNGDWLGKVLTKNARIYRGIYHSSKNEFNQLWDTGIIQVLSNNGYLADTKITKFYSEEYPIILEHTVLDICTSKTWSYEMIRDAAITLCIIRKVLLRFGYTLHDAHLNNLTFSNGRFILTDLGSIKKYDPEEWDGFPKELVFASLYKLMFYNLTNSLVKRDQIFDENNNAIWITERYYDDATIECYSCLKSFKRHLLITGRWKRLLDSYRVFDCYNIEPRYIYRLFPNRQINLQNKMSVDYDNINKLFSRVKDKCSSVCVLDSSSEDLVTHVYDSNKRWIVAVNDDMEMDYLYRKYKLSGISVDLCMQNIMYGSDEITSRYTKSDIVIGPNIFEKTKSFHNHTYESCFFAIRKVCTDYCLISYRNNDETMDVKKYLTLYFDELERIDHDNVSYCLLEAK